ncbi:MAG: hypothetical protein IT534_07200 [Bauldia sp.]|nr:hypothetical protein [Bauldia sp.]
MAARLLTWIAVAILALTGSAARGQEVPLAITSANVFRKVTGDNLLGQYDPGDVLRLEVFVTRSMQPTTVVATRGEVRVELQFYSGPMLDDLYQATIPFDPALVGPWEITVRRGGRAATTTAAGVPPAVTMPLVDDIRVETVDGQAFLAWTWPDLSGLQSRGLMVVGDIRVMQEDNLDQYQLNFGFTHEPMAIGRLGDTFNVAIPGGLEPDRLFLFRVYLTAYGSEGNVVAQSVSFAARLYSTPPR